MMNRISQTCKRKRLLFRHKDNWKGNIMNQSKNVWERLQANPTFMTAFNKYNQSIGEALTILKTQKHDIQGRKKEAEMLSGILERPLTPVAILVGPAGVGKTALVEDFTKKINEGRLQTVNNRKYFTVALRIGYLKALGTDKLQAAITGLLDQLFKLEHLAQTVLNDKNVKIILFIDEVHMLVTIFGPGTKIGGDLMKDVLARSPIRVITATTRREYDATIAVDEPFKERFKEVEMNELPKPVVMTILKNWWQSHASFLNQPDDLIFEKIIDANAAYRASQAEPRKSLDILEDLVSYEIRNKRKVTPQIVDKIFRDRFAIELSFDFNADTVFENVKNRVKGQQIALYELKRGLRSVSYQVEPQSNRPLMTLLLTGPTGVGKTETTKAIAEVLYPGEDVLVNINMPDYKELSMEPAFRKRLGEIVRHNPRAIVLLDEFEKANPSLLDALLAILDEGIVNFEVTNREGQQETHKQSLRNTIIIATTNAGSEIFQDFAKFSQNNDGYALDNKAKVEYEQLKKSLENHLKSIGFKPEMLGRFNRIIPYRGLTQNILVNIAESSLEKLASHFLKTKGIVLRFPVKQDWPTDVGYVYSSDVANYIATIRVKSDDPSSGGARGVRRAIESNVRDEIIEYILDHQDSTVFDVTVSKDSRLYDIGAQHSKGGIIINARN